MKTQVDAGRGQEVGSRIRLSGRVFGVEPIVADRGIHAKVGTEEWSKVCHQMQADFKQSNFEAGVVNGVQAVTQNLARHFPSGSYDRNELPNKPVLL